MAGITANTSGSSQSPFVTPRAMFQANVPSAVTAAARSAATGRTTAILGRGTDTRNRNPKAARGCRTTNSSLSHMVPPSAKEPTNAKKPATTTCRTAKANITFRDAVISSLTRPCTGTTYKTMCRHAECETVRTAAVSSCSGGVLPQVRAYRGQQHDEQSVDSHPVVAAGLALPILTRSKAVEPVPEEQNR